MKKTIFMLMLSAATFAAKHSNAQVRVHNLQVKPATTMRTPAKPPIVISAGNAPASGAGPKINHSDANIPVKVDAGYASDGKTTTANLSVSGDGPSVVIIVLGTIGAILAGVYFYFSIG